jgi:inhibitor of cysteine peptidase
MPVRVIAGQTGCGGKKVKRVPSVFGLLCLFFLSACGSSGSGSGGYAVSGMIMSNGVAVSGVTVTLSGTSSSSEVTTDASGKYRFSGIRNGNYTVTPSMDGKTFFPVSLAVTVKNSDLTNQNLEAVVGTEPTYTLSGTVLTAGGSGIEGVKVSVTGATAGSVFTDAEGQYSVSGLVNGSYAVTPSKTGYTFTPGSISATVNGVDLTGQNFNSSTYLISGTVTYGGLPLAGAIVVLSGPSANAAMTDTGGHYSFTGLSNGSYTVTASLTGWDLTPASLDVTISDGDSTGNNFAGVFSISGTITEGGTAVPGVTVTLSGTATGSAITDGSGNYSFNVLANGVYTVTPSLGGYTFTPENRSVTVSDADASGNDFTATPPSGSLTFNPTGAVQTWTVPNGVSSVTLTCSGGAGGAGESPGTGGTATGTLAVTTGQIFSIYVGSSGLNTVGGQNGGIGRGGNSYDWGSSATSGSAGGAASYILLEGRIMIGAGGGGGFGTNYYSNGGGGGGVGGDGSDSSSGGAGGNGYGTTGGYGNGGDAVTNSGGGGGGGLLGAGGDGAGYVSDSLTDSSSTVGGNSGNGRITISW